jgi:hypothetical protein
LVLINNMRHPVTVNHRNVIEISLLYLGLVKGTFYLKDCYCFMKLKEPFYDFSERETFLTNPEQNSGFAQYFLNISFLFE